MGRWDIVAAVALCLAFAGCASSQTPSASTTDAATTSAPSTGSPTPGTTSATGTGDVSPPAPNRLPTASLAASVSGLRANFTLSASDPDGDNLTYTFDADGKAPPEKTGSGPFPVQTNFTYAAAGAYNATLTVSDGKNTTVGTLAVSVRLAAAGKPDPVTFQGHVSAPDPYGKIPVYPNGCALVTLPAPSGTFGVTFPLDKDYEGWAWSITADFTTMWWGGPDILAAGPSGTVPAGADRVDACAQPPSTGGDFVLTLTPP